MPFLKTILTFLAELFFRAMAGKWFGQKTVDQGTYEAKTAEAKELAKPDTDYDAAIDKL